MSHAFDPSLQPASGAFPSSGFTLGLDKRKSRRVRFCATVPVQSDGDQVPPDADFEAAEARDLSQGGMSFYSETAPREPWVMIQLGEGREAMFVMAHVVRCERDYKDPQRRFIIGCEFQRQVQR